MVFFSGAVLSNDGSPLNGSRRSVHTSEFLMLSHRCLSSATVSAKPAAPYGAVDRSPVFSAPADTPIM